MKLFVLVLLITLVFSNVCLASFVDNAVDKVSDKVGEKVSTAIDNQADKLIVLADKGANWIIKKILAVIWWVTEVISIIGVGWLLSYLCDRDSRTMVRMLVVICVISLTVDKLVSLVK